MLKRFRVIWLFLIVILVTFLAMYMEKQYSQGGGDEPTPEESMHKLGEAIRFIQAYYVDEVDWEKSTTAALEGLLETLDPHSVYFDPKEVQQNEENFKGRYYGIGINYNVINGYITVLSVVEDSPSEKAGLKPGDRILKIEDEEAYNLTNDQIQSKLKGRKGTSVNVVLRRIQQEELINASITRDEIPISSIRTSFMADEITGYIWLGRFASKTADELENKIITLENQGMKRLIFDLRGNSGGYLRQAVKVVGKFIHGRKKVVYTKGKRDEFIEEYYTDDFGKSVKRDIPLIILINEGSASASEIVAGAIQDYDRGLIAGTNSFGKGLVQNEYILNDKSRIRLTVSKYYTPSGRLIQRPYKGKDRRTYYSESDSQMVDTLPDRPMYQTLAGRTVYGDGGITPDTLIETKNISVHPELMIDLIAQGVFVDATAIYVRDHAAQLSDFESFKKAFFLTNKIKRIILKDAQLKSINISLKDLNDDERYLQNRFKSELARNVWGMHHYWQVVLDEDHQFKTALRLFPEALEVSHLNQN